ncbi:MAG TPA: M20 family metallopeptidase [Actinomycetota bacterium]|nr:M20 family metallopeptidase [Actinomycetota bacterium]
MDTKQAAREAVESAREDLVALSHAIHARPELAFEEKEAAARVSDALSRAGFEVQAGICDLPTAFTATSGTGPLRVAICAEYDALPGIGHACGHNIIAASAVGAAIGAAAVADEAGLTVTVIGTPAEEGGGGKILLLERGAFDGFHVAMMVHPAPTESAEPPTLAVAHFDVQYHGKDAHASAFPELGINAADAITVAQTAIGLLRQHMRPDERVHGIVTKGGDAPNIVPSHTSAKYYVRAATLDDLDGFRRKVMNCLEAGALATGATLEVGEKHPPYAHVAHDARIAALYRRNAEKLGREFPDPGPLARRAAGSTDMGNVSLVVPSIHPMIGIGSLPAVNHQPEFTAHCVTATADKAMGDGAVAMALTAVDLATDPGLSRELTARD